MSRSREHSRPWTPAVLLPLLGVAVLSIAGCLPPALDSEGLTPAAAAKTEHGFGGLQVTVAWSTNQVVKPSVAAELVPDSGTAMSLSFTLGSGTAASTVGKVPSGAHTLVLRLLDGGTVVAAAIEVVQVEKNRTASVALALDGIDAAAPSLQTNATSQPDDPLAVNLSGQQASVVRGTGFTVSLSAEGVSENLVGAWYLNGVLRDIGAPFSVPADLQPGSYRLDVTAYTADGSRSGTTGVDFIVTAPAARTSVTLAWDPSVSSVAGYRIHYGTASSSYDALVDAGNVTVFTVAGLQPGLTYYFAATAYGSGGLESGYSNEVSCAP